jgi:hypothetical protein
MAIDFADQDMVCLVEGTAYAKALGWEGAWHGRETESMAKAGEEKSERNRQG